MRSAFGAAPDVAVVDVGLNFLSPQAGLLNHTGKKRMIRASSPHKKPVSILHGRVFFATRPKSEARNRIRIIINLMQLPRSYPGHLSSVFADYLDKKSHVLFSLSRSHAISNTYILSAGNTPYRKPHNTRTICNTPLQSISEADLYSRRSFLVRLTNQFDAFFNPKNVSETKATNK